LRIATLKDFEVLKLLQCPQKHGVGCSCWKTRWGFMNCACACFCA